MAKGASNALPPPSPKTLRGHVLNAKPKKGTYRAQPGAALNGCGAHGLEVLEGGLLVFAVGAVDVPIGALVIPLDMCAEASTSRLGVANGREVHCTARGEEKKKDP